IDLRDPEPHALWPGEKLCGRFHQGRPRERHCRGGWRGEEHARRFPRFHYGRSRQDGLPHLQLYLAARSCYVLRRHQARRQQGLREVDARGRPELHRGPILCQASERSRSKGTEGPEQRPVTWPQRPPSFRARVPSQARARFSLGCAKAMKSPACSPFCSPRPSFSFLCFLFSTCGKVPFSPATSSASISFAPPSGIPSSNSSALCLSFTGRSSPPR